MLISLLISLAFAAEPVATPPPGNELAGAPIFSAIEVVSPKFPLGGSFAEGEKLLRSGDPVKEANIVFNARGASMITVCGFACLAPGVEGKEAATGPTIPQTGDALSDANKGYNEAAMDFATRFNKQILARKSPAAVGESRIDKDLSVKERTIGNVTVGKSSLYNAVGFFGTNMFKKQSDGTSTICWQGSDGTLLAFESNVSGARDQVITGVRLFANAAEYKYAPDCKASKKVSAGLEVLGVRLGSSAADVEKKRGAPSDRSGDRMLWHYSTLVSKKPVTHEVEIATPGDKVTSISLDRNEKR